MSDPAERLLAPGEPPPVTVFNETGASPFLIVADHAGNNVPRALHKLGLPQAELDRHIGWDIGIAGVCRALGEALDAVVIQQNYSRLVIDCNRTPGSETSIATISELTPVPGNAALNDAQKAAREREIFRPYHDRIEVELARRHLAGRPAFLIAMHSFTPSFKGVARPWHTGVLYNRDASFAHLLKALLQSEGGLTVGDNEPYSVTDATDYTIPVHGERRGLHHVAIEIRQDFIAEVKAQQEWAALLARLLLQVYRRLTPSR
jgi:predicted N-formylglutamate amidohydrolase